jgi:hypothetical protein
MKRLTSRYKKHLRFRARRQAQKLRDRPVSVVTARRDRARSHFKEIRALLPEPCIDYTSHPGYCTIVPPSNFDLQQNYEQTLAFVMDMRRLFHNRNAPSQDSKRKLPVFADFAAISEITPPAGLVLAAEVDRWRLSSGRQPRSFDRDWHPDIQRFFSQAGLFELLGIKQILLVLSHDVSSRLDCRAESLAGLAESDRPHSRTDFISPLGLTCE